MAARILTLTTDFGSRDYYLAAVKGTVLRLAPGAQLVDLSHEIPPGDVEAGAFFLAAALPSFPPDALHLAVVDPGVGSARRMLAVETPHGVLLAPDNGLATPFLAAGAAYSIERPDLYLEAPDLGTGGVTFHGRDRFAPVAAFLLAGGGVAALGPPLEDAVRLAAPSPRRSGSRLEGRVAHVDRYGNLVTDIPSAWLEGAIALEASVGGHATARRATHYAELAPGEAAVLPGSLATLELALRGASLAHAWAVGRGAAVDILLWRK